MPAISRRNLLATTPALAAVALTAGAASAAVAALPAKPIPDPLSWEAALAPIPCSRR
jgi:hypothetical protein